MNRCKQLDELVNVHRCIMSFISQSTTDAALSAATWDSQMEFIEKLENRIMEPENSLNSMDVKRSLQVLARYLDTDDKSIIQRSLKVVETICDSYDLNSTSVSELVPVIIKCWSDKRGNIRERTTKTVSVIVKKFGLTPFISSLVNLNSNGRAAVLEFIRSSPDLNVGEKQQLLVFILTCLDDKSGSVRNLASEIAKTDQFTDVINSSMSKLNTTQKRLVESLFQKSSTGEEQPLQPKPSSMSRKAKTKSSYLNTSAFSRKARHENMTERDGINLLLEPTSFEPFFKQLSLDIHDVFDDSIANLLISNAVGDRLQAVEKLNSIFDTKTFANTLDVCIRWCGSQFLGRQLSVAHAALSFLLNNVTDEVTLARVEVTFIVPIITWCIATQSDAYSNLLSRLRVCCSPNDLCDALLIPLELDHSVVTSTVFEELEKIDDISTIESQVKQLTEHKNTLVRESAKSLLFRVGPASPRKRAGSLDPVGMLQAHIQKIKTAPMYISNPAALFCSLLDQYERVPEDPTHIRYLLYATHAFLTEPVLVMSVHQKDFITLAELLCEFSLQIEAEYAEALNAIGFVLVTIVSQMTLFQALLGFIEEHNGEISKQSFPYQFFTIGVSLLSVSYEDTNLEELREFAKSVISRSDLSRDDVRTSLCRSLLAEIISLEQQELIISGRENAKWKPVYKSPVKVEQESEKQTNVVPERLILFNILKKLTRNQTRTEGLQELIKFDESTTENVIATITKLIPGIRQDIEDLQKAKSRHKR